MDERAIQMQRDNSGMLLSAQIGEAGMADINGGRWAASYFQKIKDKSHKIKVNQKNNRWIILKGLIKELLLLR